ncbi:hypothetical protein Tco_0257673 [Tanacetum coccineum]
MIDQRCNLLGDGKHGSKQEWRYSHTVGNGCQKGPLRVARECTVPDFMKCQPLYFQSALRENPGHYMSDCLELKNQNYENQAEGTGAREMVHALGGGETNQDLNDIEEDINA